MEIDKVYFTVDSDGADQLLHENFKRHVDYKNLENGDVIYVMPHRQFDRFVDLATSTSQEYGDSIEEVDDEGHPLVDKAGAGRKIKITNSEPKLVSFWDIYGKELEVKDTKTVQFASGPKTYYIADFEGREYEVPEDMVEKRTNKELSEYYWKKAEAIEEEMASDSGGETSGMNYERLERLQKEMDHYRTLSIELDGKAGKGKKVEDIKVGDVVEFIEPEEEEEGVTYNVLELRGDRVLVNDNINTEMEVRPTYVYLIKDLKKVDKAGNGSKINRVGIYTDEKLEELAKRHFPGLETLQTRKSDSLDFHDLPVWQIKSALKEAGRDMLSDSELLEIAKNHLYLDTLKTRNSDALDFSEQAVWALKDALKEANYKGVEKLRKAGNGTKIEKMEIKNQYEGKSPEQVWKAWSFEQRRHFLYDHQKSWSGKTAYGVKEVNASLIDGVSFDKLPQSVKEQLQMHLEDGQYGKGKRVEDIKVGDVVEFIEPEEEEEGVTYNVLELRGDRVLVNDNINTEMEVRPTYVYLINDLKKVDKAGNGSKTPNKSYSYLGVFDTNNKLFMAFRYAIVDGAVQNSASIDKIMDFVLKNNYSVRKITKEEYESAPSYFDNEKNKGKAGNGTKIEKMEIKNQYEGKSPEQVWDAWTKHQREHFCIDHNLMDNMSVRQFKMSSSELKNEIWGKEFRNVNTWDYWILPTLADHVVVGQYGKGGPIPENKYYYLPIGRIFKDSGGVRFQISGYTPEALKIKRYSEVEKDTAEAELSFGAVPTLAEDKKITFEGATLETWRDMRLLELEIDSIKKHLALVDTRKTYQSELEQAADKIDKLNAELVQVKREADTLLNDVQKTKASAKDSLDAMEAIAKKEKATKIGDIKDGYELVKITKDARVAKNYATRLLDKGKYLTHDFRDSKTQPGMIEVWMMIKGLKKGDIVALGANDEPYGEITDERKMFGSKIKAFVVKSFETGEEAEYSEDQLWEANDKAGNGTEIGVAALYIELEKGNINVYHGYDFKLKNSPDVLLEIKKANSGSWDKIWETLNNIKQGDPKETGAAHVYIELYHGNITVYHGGSVELIGSKNRLLSIDGAKAGSWDKIWVVLDGIKKASNASKGTQVSPCSDCDAKLKAFIAKFPNNAKSWAQATDEMRDLARELREYYNDINDISEGQKGYIDGLPFREFKTPSEWNTKAKKQILSTWKKLSKEQKQQFAESNSFLNPDND